MTVVIYIVDIEKLDPDGRDWSAQLTAGRVSAASCFRQKQDRARCVGAGLLLAHAVGRHHPGHPVPPREEKDCHGKPWLPDLPDFYFNISHSGKWVVCAVGDCPLGVDIEQIRKDMMDVARRFFSSSEQNFLRTIPEENRQSAFTELWVLRESYMKATGSGLSMKLKDLEVQVGPPVVVRNQGRKVPYGLALCKLDDPGYRLGLAVRGVQSFPAYRIEQVSLSTLLKGF
ncbi:MAG: 4'-phosphopantetheinyl transferase family protein [Desulfonatronovibrio sp.]